MGERKREQDTKGLKNRLYEMVVRDTADYGMFLKQWRGVKWVLIVWIIEI